MKSIYPFSEMNIGDVREVSTHRSKKAVYSAAWEWAKKHPNEDGSRPKFKVVGLFSIHDDEDAVDRGLYGNRYHIERTA